MNISSQNSQPVSGGFRVDVSRGSLTTRVSSQWFSRPDDERFLSLTELYDAVRARADRAFTAPIAPQQSRLAGLRRLASQIEGPEWPEDYLSSRFPRSVNPYQVLVYPHKWGETGSLAPRKLTKCHDSL